MRRIDTTEADAPIEAQVKAEILNVASALDDLIAASDPFYERFLEEAAIDLFARGSSDEQVLRMLHGYMETAKELELQPALDTNRRRFGIPMHLWIRQRHAGLIDPRPDGDFEFSRVGCSGDSKN